MSRWRLRGRHVIAIGALILTVTFVTGALAVWLPGRLGFRPPDAFLDVLGLALPPVAALFAVWFVGIRGFGLDWPAFGFAPATGRHIALAFGIWLLCLPLLGAILYGLHELTGTTPIQEQTRHLPPGALDDPLLGPIVGLLIIAGAPLGEELIFRGLFFGWLRRHLSLWPAAIISALVFAAIHGIPVVMPPVLVLGIAFAWLYEKTGSLWPAIAVHAFHNALVFVTTTVAQREDLPLSDLP
jgi:uncharacterized protein